jgi:hypothetical protein
MPVRYTSNIEEAKRLHREAMAEDMNEAAKQHLNWADFRTPVGSGRLRESNRQTQEATPDKPAAIVASGGIEVRGVMVDYAEAVNAKDPYWTESEEVGRETIKRRGANRKSESRRGGGRRRAFVESPSGERVG